MREGPKDALWAAVIALAVGVTACASTAVTDFTRGYAQGNATALAQYQGQTLTPEQRGALAFTLSDFGGLNTDTLESHAVPWRVAATALAMADVARNGGTLDRGRVQTVMARFGFLYPDHIGNWPQGLAPPQRTLDAPFGLAVGVVGRDVPAVRLTSANLACAACHAGVSYDADGDPITNTVWLGTPNTSLDLEAYVLELYAAFRAMRGNEPILVNAVAQLYPDTTVNEMRTIQNFVLPRLQARLDTLRRTGDRPLPFVNGAPGLTNGVAALRMQFNLLPGDGYESMRGFTSIPDLSARGFRTGLLYDMAYAPAGSSPRVMTPGDITQEHLDGLATVTAFFTVPSMGVHPDRAALHLDDAKAVFSYLRDYAPPRFPGRIERARATRGRAIYAERCASCHGTYDDSVERPTLVSFPNWIGPYNTDPVRAAAFNTATAEAVTRSAYGDRMLVRATSQYAAPLLTGLWLSAPYLHNGSVPTLWHLMRPKERPDRFMVGGHRLDFTRVGIAGLMQRNGDFVYPSSYRPWSTPQLVDTSRPGLSNVGHDEEFARMSETEKRALLEYLKLL